MRKWQNCNFMRHWYLTAESGCGDVEEPCVFVGNTGHFHNEIDFAGSEGLDGVKVKAGGPF